MKPYIICHMIQSIDGRIDCDMTEKIDDTEHYYDVLAKLNCDASIEGRVTLEKHYAKQGVEAQLEVFNLKGNKEYKPAGVQFYKAKESDKWAVGVDSQGSLAWGDDVESQFDCPLVMILCEFTPTYYLDYLKEKGISYITTSDLKVDLKEAMDVLAREFGVKRLAVVGGGHLNGSFLDLGLIDEISMMYASGVDAREGFAASFDGRSKDCEPIRLNLESVEKLDDIIWARYSIKK